MPNFKAVSETVVPLSSREFQEILGSSQIYDYMIQGAGSRSEVLDRFAGRESEDRPHQVGSGDFRVAVIRSAR